MRISDSMLESVCFLGYVKDEEFRLLGTGFFVRHQKPGDEGLGQRYLVTAKHCVVNAPAPMAIRLNTREGYELLGLPSNWMFPPDERVDVAVLRIDIDACKFSSKAIGLLSAVTDELLHQNAIGIGNEVLATGLFGSHHGKKQNLPIARHGILSAMPHEPLHDPLYGDYNAYLVELHSLNGLSGAPVYVHVPQQILFVRHPDRKFRDDCRRAHPAGYLFLLGVMRGHFKEPTSFGDVHDGIAAVTPMAEVLKLVAADRSSECDVPNSA